MNGPIRRMASLLFLGFGLLLGALTWFQVLGADGYRSDPRNVRTAINISGKERGLIVTSSGTVLADPTPTPRTRRPICASTRRARRSLTSSGTHPAWSVRPDSSPHIATSSEAGATSPSQTSSPHCSGAT